MSFSAFFYLVSVVAAYQLGGYNARHPHALPRCVKELWAWMNKLGQSNRQS